MVVYVKLQFEKTTRKVDGIRAEETEGQLVVYNAEGKIVGRFDLPSIERWWTESL